MVIAPRTPLERPFMLVPNRRTRVGAVSAIAALLIAGVASIALDLRAPGAGPLVQPLSSFAHTDVAWLWRLTVAAGATGLGLLAATLRDEALAGAFSRSLAAASLGLVVAGGCAADVWFPWERAPTLLGSIHLGAVLLTGVALSVAIALRARSLPSDSGTVAVRISERLYGGAVLGGSAYLGAMAAAGRPPHFFGLVERLVLGTAWAWSLLLAAHAMRRRADRARPASPTVG